MTSDPESPLSAHDLVQQRLLAESVGLGTRPAKPAPRPMARPAPLPPAGALPGEGVTDTADLLRLVSLIKAAEAATGVPERQIVIGEFSVVVSRVPERQIAVLQALTRAEAACMRMLGWGRTNADMAMLLDSNENTVRTHMNNVIRKIQLDGMRELIALSGLLFHPME